MCLYSMFFNSVLASPMFWADFQGIRYECRSFPLFYTVNDVIKSNKIQQKLNQTFKPNKYLGLMFMLLLYRTIMTFSWSSLTINQQYEPFYAYSTLLSASDDNPVSQPKRFYMCCTIFLWFCCTSQSCFHMISVSHLSCYILLYDLAGDGNRQSKCS